MRYIISFIFTIACIGSISAQKVVSLKECLEIGLQHNYDLQIIRNKQQIADNNATMANAGMLPTLDLAAGYSGTADQTSTTPRQGESYTTDASYNQAMDVGVSLGWTIFNGLKVKGIYRGYKGLITNEIKDFKTENVSNIVQQGGTILKTARCPEFKTEEGRAQAWKNMCEHGIDALVVIGGDGSLSGARILAQEYDIPCIGIPGTIDNDLYGTDTTLGYDTALNTIVEAVDKIRDTANSHERIFFVEVMGRDAGFLALNSAIASGAEAAIIPEHLTQEDQLATFIQNGMRKSKNSSIVLVSENPQLGGALHYAERVRNEFPQFDVRVSILGHLQRGGRPTAHDRIIAGRMGAASIEALLDGQRNVMIGIRNDEIVYVPFNTAIKKDKPIDNHLMNVLHMLSI